MEREKIFYALEKLAGSKKLYLPESRIGNITIGEFRPVVALSKKYAYMGCKCYLKWTQDGDEYVQSVQRIPIAARFGEVTNKVSLENLSTRDLKQILDGFVGYLKWERDHNLPSLKQKLQESEECVKRLNKVDNYLQ